MTVRAALPSREGPPPRSRRSRRAVGGRMDLRSAPCADHGAGGDPVREDHDDAVLFREGLARLLTEAGRAVGQHLTPTSCSRSSGAHTEPSSTRAVVDIRMRRPIRPKDPAAETIRAEHPEIGTRPVAVHRDGHAMTCSRRRGRHRVPAEGSDLDRGVLRCGAASGTEVRRSISR
jgi:hypothetical protein